MYQILYFNYWSLGRLLSILFHCSQFKLRTSWFKRRVFVCGSFILYIKLIVCLHFYYWSVRSKSVIFPIAADVKFGQYSFGQLYLVLSFEQYKSAYHYDVSNNYSSISTAGSGEKKCLTIHLMSPSSFVQIGVFSSERPFLRAKLSYIELSNFAGEH